MNRKILVTGASSEMGAAVCRRLASPGDALILHACRGEEKCRLLAGTLSAECTVIRADFADPAGLDALCARAAECDILVNCAAVTRTGLLVGMEDADVAKMVSVNVLALVRLCASAARGMLPRRVGAIVNVSSVAASRGNPGQAVYAGTKGFMEAFTRSLAAEYGPKGIRVNCVAPGPIEAGSLKELLAEAGDEVRGSTALRRLGRVEEVAAAVAFLCGADAAYVTGAVLRVDGGFGRGI